MKLKQIVTPKQIACLSGLALAWILTSVASAATITFDDVPLIGCQNNPPTCVAGSYSVDTPQGFTFHVSVPVYTDISVINSWSANNTQVIRTLTYGGGTQLTMEATDGSAFDLSSFEMWVETFIFTERPYLIEGFNADGLVVASKTVLDPGTGTAWAGTTGVWQTIAFGTEWTALDRVVINPSLSCSCFGDIEGGAMVFDNFNVSVVPIPAAVWLFGSGLGLLGWLCRRQTA